MAERSAAIKQLDLVLKDNPKSEPASETVYLKEVANYVETHDVSHLKKPLPELEAGFPAQHTWTM